METVMFTFHKFAGDKNYLTKEDLRLLMEKEVPGYMEVSEEKGCGGGVPQRPLSGEGVDPCERNPPLRQPFSSFSSSSSSVITLSLLSSR